MNAFFYSHSKGFLWVAIGVIAVAVLLIITAIIIHAKKIWHEMFCRDYDCCRGYHTNNEEFDFEGHTIRK